MRSRAVGIAALLLLGLAAAASARTATERELESFRQGNTAYEAGNYETAVEAYESLIAAGIESKDVYFNLGNAWLKQGRLGPAILNYRRALRLDPSDDDAAANLAYARARTQDATPQDAPDPFPWLTALRPGADTAGVFYLVGLNVFALLFALRYVLRRPPAILGPLTGTTAAVAALLAVGFWFEAEAEGKSAGAVVMAESSEVKSGPGDDYTVAFVVHEGTEVATGRTSGPWTEITVTSELKGWVASSAIEEVE
jgi:tetratricopeptide (TPR) repeat protein